RPRALTYRLGCMVRDGPSGGRLGMVRVLVVEDDPVIRALIVEVLAYEGMSSLEAGDGQVAVSLAITAQPTVILMDLMLPVLAGARRSRATRSRPCERRSGRERKALVALGYYLIASLAIDPDAADIWREYPRLAGNVCAHVPGVRQRVERGVPDVVDELHPGV